MLTKLVERGRVRGGEGEREGGRGREGKGGEEKGGEWKGGEEGRESGS